eukprot:CAMPEP_0113329554 /NCGR_PEP_ID=MMETSP0010_2-20120614/20972_1 /TAXON_ID=216773 ORGANISM="Corethron hystrix, Strain 308" /NCGR_SAMPLE_ID=MMETSP0010_2 /ASSEMBLY_ACC=CAM_ASM_000155 /LENGTH=143 /DNA_ID=CAMNT_0000191671 /DNA_START=55 /DNA_END=486 /DNA_ORIENTATION=- /assembly_acc=CAM_ASM_000155
MVTSPATAAAATTIKCLAPFARSGYRKILRARSSLFGRDVSALRQSAVIIRQEFDKNKHVTDIDEARNQVNMIDECIEMLKYGIVQGELNDRGNYAVKIDPERSAVTRNDDRIDVEPIDSETVKPKIPEVVKTTVWRRRSESE